MLLPPSVVYASSADLYKPPHHGRQTLSLDVGATLGVIFLFLVLRVLLVLVLVSHLLS